MTSNEIRQKFLTFFKDRGHTIIPSASLVPKDYGDNGTLFTTAGMQPIIPYLLGKKHPAGRRIANIQKCVRTGDIEDVGDNRHLTFFEMMGNWSLGDYFKKESLEWSFDFLTNKDYGLGLDPARFYVTVFKGEPATAEGETSIPRDEESIAIWQKIFTKFGLSSEVAGEDSFIKDDIRIIPLGTEDNFWIAGTTGPCGADSEIFYDTRPEEEILMGRFDDLVNSGRIIEVWNNVFMEFNKTSEGKYLPLTTKNVDTGMGLERIVSVINKVDVFSSDLFTPIINEIKNQSSNLEDKSVRIVADHIRTAVFMIADGVIPANTDRGYVLRRIIRRAVRHADKLGARAEILKKLASIVIENYKNIYSELEENQVKIFEELAKEEDKFRKTLAQGLKEFEKGRDPFDLYQTFGFPIELTEELAKEKGIEIDRITFDNKMRQHQDISKSGSEQKFKGGLANNGESETKYHTATHLLLSALRQVLGTDVVQKGSNITAERLRFDFSWPDKLTPEQIKAVENLVNKKITEAIPVEMIELPKEEAKKIVTVLSFDESKYGEMVKIYKIGDFSAEFCGGPHVSNTSELGIFKIAKEEASSAGVRRIKAILE